MRYYYQIIRVHLSNQSHIRNRKNLDISWRRLLEDRRRLRVLETERLKKNNINIINDE